jgi:PKD repeat protein
LVGGDTFQVLAFGSKSGDFTTTNLPPLTGTLIWDTSQLGSSGIISVVLPATITDPAPQAVLTNTDVTISTVVTGVPTPVLQWQKDGGSLVDGATGNGSTISGSASSSLVISNAQVADSGQYCLIASNTAGAVTNCMTLEVTVDTAAPLIGGLHNQNVISPNSATFSAMVAGIPAPTLQWQDNGSDIANETNTTLVIPGVTFALDGHSYCIIASNSVGTATNCASLFVVVPPLIQTQPQDVTVTNSGSATFTVVSTNGVPAPTFQWYFNNIPIANATNTSYTIANATPANAGSYKAVVANVVGSATSSNATLTVTSTMSAGLTPTNGATAVCYDTPLYMAFDRVPVATGTGTIKIFNVTNSVTPVDTINMASGSPQPRTIGFENFNTFPIIITASNAAIYPHLGVLSSNQTYYVTVDQGVFVDSVGALFAGISDTNAWRFSTKQTGPVNPNNVTVAFDGSGDFCTVQGAVDSLPSGNTTYTLVTIHNGTYTEIVDTRNKNHITFRGQSRAGTIVGYKNNDPQNPGTHFRMAFKVFGTDTAIENMTVVNTTPQGGQQAEALMLESAAVRFILNNAELDSRQDTILANGVPQSQGYFYNSLVQGNFDYIWGGGNLYFTKCEIRTIPGSSTFNLTAARTDFGTLSGYWTGAPNFPTTFASNGMSFVNCRLTRSSGSTVSNITMAGANGATDGLAAFINCSIDVSNNNGYIIPPANVLSNELVWEFGNSNLDGTASVTFGMTFPPLSNGDTRLTAALDPTIWLNGWVPQLAPNILTNPVSVTVTAGVNATFSVAATGIPDPTYQWQIGGSNLVGQTGSTLTVSNARCADAGTYSVIVSNIAGVVTSSNATLTVIGTAPVASFTAGPSTSGTEPLSVTFTDTSTGSPTSLAWDFGDLSSTTTTGGATVVHAYAAGTYTVTLTASNACDISTLVSNNMISVVTAFQAWQLQYFGCTNCSQADANADPDGDGVNNGNEFATGFNPNSAAAYAHIIKVVKSGPDMNITYLGANGDSTWSPGIASRTNVLEFTHGSGSGYNGNYSNNFVSVTGGTTNLSGGFGTGTVVTVTDTGAASATNRYYRIRVIAP